MPSIVTCPNCGNRFRAQDRLAGRTVACPTCKGALTVPACQVDLDLPTPQVPIHSAYSTLATPSARAKRRGNHRLLIVVGVIGSTAFAFLLIAIAVTQWWSSRPSNEPNQSDPPPAAASVAPPSTTARIDSAIPPIEPTANVAALPTPKKPVIRSGASPDDVTVEIPIGWSVGDKVEYRMTRGSQKTSGRNSAQNKSETDLKIEVLEANAEGYRLLWQVGRTVEDLPPMADEKLVALFKNDPNSFRAILRLDKNGRLIALENWQELGNKLRAALASVVVQVPSGFKDERRENELKVIDSMIASEGGALEYFVKEAQTFFVPIGRSCSAAPQRYEMPLSAKMEGPLPTEISLQLKNLNRAANEVVLSWKRTVPADVSQRYYTIIMRVRIAEEPAIEQRLKDLTMVDSAEFVYDLSSIWPKQITHSRSTTGKISGLEEDTLLLTRK